MKPQQSTETVPQKAKRWLYAPPKWIVSRFSQEDRMVFGFYTFIGALIGTVFFGTMVLWVSVLSVVALIPNFTSETPVEIEKK